MFSTSSIQQREKKTSTDSIQKKAYLLRHSSLNGMLRLYGLHDFSYRMKMRKFECTFYLPRFALSFSLTRSFSISISLTLTRSLRVHKRSRRQGMKAINCIIQLSLSVYYLSEISKNAKFILKYCLWKYARSKVETGEVNWTKRMWKSDRASYLRCLYFWITIFELTQKRK